MVLKSFGRTWNHPNIVAYMGATVLSDQPLVILMEYLKYGGLNQYQLGDFHIKLRVKFGLDMSKGLIFIHENSMRHGNLKPSNILVTDNQSFSCFLLLFLK